MDVNASGRNDIVLVSSRYDQNLKANGLYLDVYLSDAQGNVSSSSAAGSGFTGLLYPDHLFGVEVSGNGRNDFVSPCERKTFGAGCLMTIVAPHQEYGVWLEPKAYSHRATLYR